MWNKKAHRTGIGASMCLFFLACMSGAFADSPPAALTHSECVAASSVFV